MPSRCGYTLVHAAQSTACPSINLITRKSRVNRISRLLMFKFSVPNLGVRQTCVTLVTATSALLAGISHAQHDHAATATPTTPPVSSPTALKFDSVLSRYKPMTDQKLGSWREANDTVTRIGGWRTYLKESQTPDVAAPTPANAPAAPAPVAPVAPSKANPHAVHGAKP